MEWSALSRDILPRSDSEEVFNGHRKTKFTGGLGSSAFGDAIEKGGSMPHC
jgi:hypothetical protein